MAVAPELVLQTTEELSPQPRLEPVPDAPPEQTLRPRASANVQVTRTISGKSYTCAPTRAEWFRMQSPEYQARLVADGWNDEDATVSRE